MIASNFRRVIVVGDNDVAGTAARQQITDRLSSRVDALINITVPEPFKDAGDMTTPDALAMIGPHLFK